MMKRRIFLWMGLIVLFLSFGLCRETLAKETYKVKRGDSIAAIAKKHGVSAESLKKANRMKGNALKPGQALVIPKHSKQKTAISGKSHSSTYSYRVKKGDTLASISKKTGISVNEIKRINNIHSRRLKVGQKILLSKREALDREKPVQADSAATETDESAEEGDPTGTNKEEINVTEIEKEAQSS